MKLFKAIIATITDIFIIALFIILVLFMYSKLIAKDKIPNMLGYSLLRIKSESMEPNYHIGDYIIIKKQDKYKIDDIVTYIDDSDNLITHRIISINESDVVTKGDANNTEDEMFDVVNIQGKVVYKLPSIFSKINAITLLVIIGILFLIRIIIAKFVN